MEGKKGGDLQENQSNSNLVASGGSGARNKDAASNKNQELQYELSQPQTKQATRKPEGISNISSKDEQTLLKMNYDKRLIKKAESNLERNHIPLDLTSLLNEVQKLDKEEYFGASSNSTNRVAEETVRLKAHVTPRVPHALDEREKQLITELRYASQERDAVKRPMICIICKTRTVEILFLTCRHFVTCNECGDIVRDCPICKQVIVGTVEVFMA